MEYINCPICEVNDSEFFYDKERNNDPVMYVICKKCGLVYQNPRKTYEEYKIYYQEEFRKQNIAGHNIDDYINSRIKSGKEILKIIEQYYPIRLMDRLKKKYTGNRKVSVLDVGCGAGGIIYPFISKGYTCVGIDAPSEYTKIGREKLGVDIKDVFILDFDPKNKFDIIILNHSLEHFLEPVNYLIKIRELLSKHGIVYIEVPDIERPYSWTSLRYFFMLGHVFYYSPVTLTVLLNKCGFEMIYIESGKTAFMRSLFIKKNDTNYKVNSKYYSEIIKKFNSIKEEKNE